MKRLLIVAHAPSPNTRQLRDAALDGAREGGDGGVEILYRPPLEAGPEDVLNADGILLGTTENLGYMSGALKDFFDRTYYGVLEQKQGLPYGLFIRAGMDGTGTRRAVESIATGLRWKPIQDPIILRGVWQTEFPEECRNLAMMMAAGLDAGIF